LEPRLSYFSKMRGALKWQEAVLGNSIVKWDVVDTDDRGYFRLAGIPKGTCVVSATLPTQTFYGAGITSGSVRHQMDRLIVGVLEVYSGNALRLKNAKPISIGRAEQVLDVDIVVPLSSLYQVSGIVTAQRDGHRLGSGILELLYADDMSIAQRAYLNEDGTFLFNFLMEGNYVLKVVDASDAEEAKSSQANSQSGTVAQALLKYDSVSVPISVVNNVRDVDIAVPEEPRSQSQ
jgi:hypothetical protein